jgi:hypothetical protein
LPSHDGRGDLTPIAKDIARGAHCSRRTIFEHFTGLADVYAEAIEDASTSAAVLNHVLGEDWRTGGVPERFVKPIVRAIVAGDARQPRSSLSHRR